MAIQVKKDVKAPAVVQSIAQPKSSGELAAAMGKIKKELGEKSIVYGNQIPNPERLPTGVFEFDLATGGGFPKNRYSIVYGPESSGKTNLIYKAIASAQRLPPPCNRAIFVDLEGTFDPTWATKFGVDVDALIVAKPSYGEQAVDMIDSLVRADDVAFLAVDSIAVMIAAKEVDGSTEKADVGTSALLIKRLSNKLAIALSEEQKRDHNVCVVLLNQTRFKIGVMFGDPETMPGGQTVKFNASLIVRLYGKNLLVKEISADIPAFKSTNAVIKKAKIGIIQQSFTYDMAMIEHDGLMPGETASFNAVKGYLQAAGHLKKSEKGGGWELLGKTYPTLSIIQDTYYAEPEFSLQLNSLVVKSQSLSLVAAESLSEPQP
jgi:recombination protein RecA